VPLHLDQRDLQVALQGRRDPIQDRKPLGDVVGPLPLRKGQPAQRLAV
jgi:hypothetical protein